MRNRKENKSFSVILEDYNEILNAHKLSQPDEIKAKINNLQYEAQKSIEQSKKEGKESAIFALFLFILLIFAGIYIFILGKDNDNLYNDNIEKTNIINKLQWTDSLFNQLMDVKYDSIGNRSVFFTRDEIGKIITYDELRAKNDSLKNILYDLQWSNKIFDKIMTVDINPSDRSKSVSYLTIDGKVITYGELGDMYKDLQIENNDLKNKMSNLMWTDSIFNQIIFVEIDPISKSRSISLHYRNGKVVKYNELSSEVDTLNQELRVLKSKLNLIQLNYNIMFKETNNGISIHADKIDSALLLLPYYRDKLLYDPQKKSWIITLPSK
jgi:hypothetical protein